MTTDTAHEALERALDLLTSRYIFPEKADAAARLIRARRSAGAYDGLDPDAFCERVTEDLYEVCGDKHLRFRVRAGDVHEAMTDAELEAAWSEQQRLASYGIARVERLAGNVGLIKLRGVTDPSFGATAIAAAMELVSQTHALVFDLRENRGGSPDGVIFWNSYLFPDSDTLLNTIYDGASGETRQYWTLAYVPGRRYLDRPVFVLTSDFTFSAGEEFAYNLKAQKRAVLIGETTRGGAHPTDVVPLTATLELTIPIARSINPVTGTNWEGVGVEPDVPVPSAEAFDVGYRRALEHVLGTDTSAAVLDEAREALAGLGESAAGDGELGVRAESGG
jgi:C-terminal processing protease CtpA/Prc